MQAPMLSLPDGDVEKAGQSSHDASVFAVTVLNLPALHSVQVSEPADVLYVPGAHAVHCDSDGDGSVMLPV